MDYKIEKRGHHLMDCFISVTLGTHLAHTWETTIEGEDMEPKGNVPRPKEITKVTAAIHNWLTKLDDADYERVMQEAQDRSWKRTFKGHGDQSAIEHYYKK